MAGKNGSALLSREDLLSGKTFRFLDIDAGNGKSLRLRHLSAAELLAFGEDEEKDTAEPGADPDKDKAYRRMARMLCLLAIDVDGKPALNPQDESDVTLILEKLSSSVLLGAVKAIVKATNVEMAEAGER